MNKALKTYIIASVVFISVSLVYILPALFNLQKAEAQAITPNNSNVVLPSVQTNIKPVEQDVVVKTCRGNWLYISSVGIKIDLGYENVSSWNYKSIPSILSETKGNENTVILGHNYCEGGNCFSPTTDFAQIINVQKGDIAAACIDNILYQGEVLVSKSFDDSATYILDNWLDRPIVTAFTCYGECYSQSCQEVKSRWAIAFAKN
ncbi:hypothetical protein KC678_01890 [Candidatus Dojkabacteria bacterium]|uniref:Sortase n=1 Tax=Candidatus Dojkabacteria bacterium TaxID=2099670 RepID=A0A955L1M6_9BACT|nr:hypothetical protein [Candidatus Dojkabacteria bacterium]